MATDSTPAPVNGTYASSQSQNYVANEQPYLNNASTISSTNATAYGNNHQSDNPNSTEKNGSGGTSDIPKAEVGWYFVERYYTTLSRSPEKLHVRSSSNSMVYVGDKVTLIMFLALL